jgi:hypothetical protein
MGAVSRPFTLMHRLDNGYSGSPDLAKGAFRAIIKAGIFIHLGTSFGFGIAGGPGDGKDPEFVMDLEIGTIYNQVPGEGCEDTGEPGTLEDIGAVGIGIESDHGQPGALAQFGDVARYLAGLPDARQGCEVSGLVEPDETDGGFAMGPGRYFRKETIGDAGRGPGFPLKALQGAECLGLWIHCFGLEGVAFPVAPVLFVGQVAKASSGGWTIRCGPHIENQGIFPNFQVPDVIGQFGAILGKGHLRLGMGEFGLEGL